MTETLPPDHEAIEHGTPWAMPLVVLRDKHAMAREVDVAEAAATAVVRLLADPRSAPDGPWHEAVQLWRNARIRKLVRRADGKRWDDVQEFDGVTVTFPGHGEFGSASVRALVPGPVTPLPKALGKLQVSGTIFPSDSQHSGALGAIVTVEVRPGLGMSSGKLAAQCAHAAQLAWEHMPQEVRQRWAADGYRVRVTYVNQEAWDGTQRPVTITDAGLTELDGPTDTTRAWWQEVR